MDCMESISGTYKTVLYVKILYVSITLMVIILQDTYNQIKSGTLWDKKGHYT